MVFVVRHWDWFMVIHFFIHTYSISSIDCSQCLCTVIYFYYCTVLLWPGRYLFLFYSLFQCIVTCAVIVLSLLHLTQYYLLYRSYSVFLRVYCIALTLSVFSMSTVSLLSLFSLLSTFARQWFGCYLIIHYFLPNLVN